MGSRVSVARLLHRDGDHRRRECDGATRHLLVHEQLADGTGEKAHCGPRVRLPEVPRLREHVEGRRTESGAQQRDSQGGLAGQVWALPST